MAQVDQDPPAAMAHERGPVVDFDHHSPELARQGHAMWRDLRKRCPVAWTEAYGGYWVLTDYATVASVARDDHTFSSQNDCGGGPRKGINIPGVPFSSGLIETDPPRFTALRRALNPWFAQKAVTDLEPQVIADIRQHVDRIVDAGGGDLVEDLASPVPALLTVRMLGLPVEEAPRVSDLMHRYTYTPPLSAEREVLEGQLFELAVTVIEHLNQRLTRPTDDLMSFIAHMEVDGEQIPLDEALSQVMLVMGGGVDTTTALLANTFVHLHRDRAARAWLQEDHSRLARAGEEYLRYFTPVQGLARTATAACSLNGATVSTDDRLWLSWAAANTDPTEFDDPETIRLDRFPNRHVAFGLGAHRCLGSHLARLVWRQTVQEVLTRMPDYVVVEEEAEPYPSIGVTNGWIRVPVRLA